MDDHWFTKPRFSWLHFTAFVLAGALLAVFKQALPWWAADMATIGCMALVGAIAGLALRLHRNHQRAKVAQRGQ